LEVHPLARRIKGTAAGRLAALVFTTDEWPKLLWSQIFTTDGSARRWSSPTRAGPSCCAIRRAQRRSVDLVPLMHVLDRLDGCDFVAMNNN
jgi:hypothetical protein